MTRLLRVVTGALLATLAASSLWAQTSGRITGTITDSSGAAMPGVVVTVTSPSLQGARSATSAADGEFRLLLLPPGTYTLKAALSGFKTYDQKDIVVGVDRTVALAVKLAVASVSETVEVSGESPVVDTASATSGVNATAELFDRIPLQRNFGDVARVAPGTQQDAVGIVIYGSTGAENQYIIEGLNTTGVRSGRPDEVAQLRLRRGDRGQDRRHAGRVRPHDRRRHQRPHEVRQQRLPRLGLRLLRGQGSGQQRQHGSGPAGRDHTTVTQARPEVRLRREPGRLSSSRTRCGSSARTTASTRRTTPRSIRPLHDAGQSDRSAASSRSTTTSDLYSGKVTWRLAPNHTITGSIFGDPRHPGREHLRRRRPGEHVEGHRRPGRCGLRRPLRRCRQQLVHDPGAVRPAQRRRPRVGGAGTRPPLLSTRPWCPTAARAASG